ncbi:Peroxin/Dysferlin domain-containing protein [Spinellus fusiger]|nr:Peroxin/Dysferlin domain-containing protein [Spinellus fusiger]
MSLASTQEESLPNFSSPYSVDTIDQIPTPILNALVTLGPVLHSLVKLIRIITWQGPYALSALAILLWIITCLRTQTVLQCLPLVIVLKLARDWLNVRMLRSLRETFERKRQKKVPKTKVPLQEEALQKDEKEDMVRRKIRPQNQVLLDDTLHDLMVLQQWVAHLQQEINSLLVYLDGTQSECIVAVLGILVYAWPVWWLLVWWLGTHAAVALIGVVVLLRPSPYYQVAKRSVQRNRVLCCLVSSLYGYSIALLSYGLLKPLINTKSIGIWQSVCEWYSHIRGRGREEKRKAEQSIMSAHTLVNGPAKSEMIFQFEVYENQRWWLGMGWTTNMMSSERTAWTDNQLMAIMSKEKFDLPESTEAKHSQGAITKQWTWVDSDWWVDMTGELYSKVDKNGWSYGNNAWQQWSGSAGINTYTRCRRWCRRARLIERHTSLVERTSHSSD